MSVVDPSRRPSFANRLLTWFVAVIVVIAAITILVLRTSLLIADADRVEGSLLQEVDELETLARDGTDPNTGQPFGRDIERIFEVYLSRNLPASNEAILTLLDARVFLRSVGEPPYRLDLDPQAIGTFGAATGPVREALDTPVGRVDYVAIPIQGGPVEAPVVGTFVVAYFTDLAQSQTDRALITVTIAVSVAALLLTAAFALWLSRQLTRPLTAMAATAEALDGFDLTRRVEVPTDRELASLATTVNGMLDRIQTLIETQKRFLADAGHELRTPITIVSGHLDVLDDDPVEREETLEMVQDELARMGRIVGDISMLAKAEQPDFLQPAPVEIPRLVERLEHVVSQIADRRWTVRSRGPASLGTAVADEDRLVQAVVALSENAARHTEDGAAIAVTVHATPSTLSLSVADNGPGVPVDIRDTLFDRFVRHGARRGGAGLGLSIVRSIAEGHHGEVRCRSEPGSGATFTVEIPMQPPPEVP